MLRNTGNEEQVLDRTAEVAATIAEEGLRYVSDSSPSYTRKRTGTTFSYYDRNGAHRRRRRRVKEDPAPD
jgi:DNA topoisomerase-1